MRAPHVCASALLARLHEDRRSERWDLYSSQLRVHARAARRLVHGPSLQPTSRTFRACVSEALNAAPCSMPAPATPWHGILPDCKVHGVRLSPRCSAHENCTCASEILWQATKQAQPVSADTAMFTLLFRKRSVWGHLERMQRKRLGAAGPVRGGGRAPRVDDAQQPPVERGPPCRRQCRRGRPPRPRSPAPITTRPGTCATWAQASRVEEGLLNTAVNHCACTHQVCFQTR